MSRIQPVSRELACLVSILFDSVFNFFSYGLIVICGRLGISMTDLNAYTVVATRGAYIKAVIALTARVTI